MAQVGTDLTLLFEFVDDTGTRYTPTPLPTVNATRINDDLSTDTLASGVAASVVSTGVVGIVIAAASNDAAGTIDAAAVTTDTGIAALLRTAYASVDVTESAAVDLSGIEADLAVIKAKALLITEDNTTFTQPNDPITGDLAIVRGDDYTLASARPVPTWSNADWTPLSLTTALSITFKAKSRATGAVFTKTAEALSDTSVRVQLTNAETAVWRVGREAYDYDLEAVLANGAIVTLAQGNIHVWSDVR